MRGGTISTSAHPERTVWMWRSARKGVSIADSADRPGLVSPSLVTLDPQRGEVPDDRKGAAGSHHQHDTFTLRPSQRLRIGAIPLGDDDACETDEARHGDHVDMGLEGYPDPILL